MLRWLCLLLLAASPALAESLVATRLILPGATVAAADVALARAAIPDALTAPDQAIGQTARVAIYAGRPLFAADLGPAISVTRNQSVTLRYDTGALVITAEGRALGQGGAGDTIRVLNTASKTTLSGRIMPDGTIEIGNTPCAGC